MTMDIIAPTPCQFPTIWQFQRRWIPRKVMEAEEDGQVQGNLATTPKEAVASRRATHRAREREGERERRHVIYLPPLPPSLPPPRICRYTSRRPVPSPVHLRAA